MLRGANMNLYLCLNALMLSNYFLPQAGHSVILLTGERCHTVNISSRHRTDSIKVEKPSEPAGTSFRILFSSTYSKYSKSIKRRLLLV